MKNRILKGLVLFALGLGVSNAYAAAAGFYLGAMGGPATNDGPSKQAQVSPNSAPGTTVTVTATPKSTMGGFRAYMGYKWVDWAGIELGATYYSVVNYTTPISTGTSMKAGVAAVDLVGVGSFQLYTFSVFGKLGAAVVYQGVSRSLRPAVGESKYTTKIVPTFGVGVGYDLTQNWVVDLSWTRLMTGSYLKNIDLYALGISYHFVDRYCGQFLCDD